MYSVLVVFVVLIFLFLVSCCLVFVVNYSKEFNTAYECGFDSFGSARVPFSISFFLLILLFLVFDVEVVILFPVCMILFRQLSVTAFISSVLFLLVLLLGLLFEYWEGSLNWLKC